jgi:predicted dienelactone hydrolase
MNLHRRYTVSLPFIPLATLLALSAQAQTLAQTAVQDQTWRDPARQRDIPVRIRWPTARAGAGGEWPVLLFSHGMGGTLESGSVWGEAWARAGFVVIHLQHPGSDLDAVRGSGSAFTDPSSLRRLGSPQQLLARLKDVGFGLDELARRKAGGEGNWANIRAERVGLSGHSFGAHTTLGMAGQRYPGFDGIAEPRLAAFMAFSPSQPATGNAIRAFERITRPVLCLTGTRDSDVAGTGASPEQRRGVFTVMPAGNKSQLVLQDADHMTFAGQTGNAVEIIPRAAVTRELQALHHAAVSSVSTDWWLDHLLDDDSARQRLAKPAGLAAGDVWQTR